MVSLKKGYSALRITLLHSKEDEEDEVALYWSGPGFAGKKVIPATAFAASPHNCEAGEFSKEAVCRKCEYGSFSGNGATSCTSCWHRASEGHMAALSASSGTRFQYLFSNKDGWIMTPPSSAKWDWHGFQEIPGEYEYAKGAKRGSFVCKASKVKGPAGVGCGDKGTHQVLIASGSFNAHEGTADICNSVLWKSCAATQVFVRVAPTMPHLDSAVKAGIAAIPWIASGVCFRESVIDSAWAHSNSFAGR
jgi:hypothetical protein